MRHALLIACLALAACASPAVDTAAPNFSDAQYVADLDECQGGNTLLAAAKGMGGMVIGSVYGLFHGAYLGAISGNGSKGAAIGTAAGATLGFAGGLYKPIKEHEEKLEQCLIGKGYTLQL